MTEELLALVPQYGPWLIGIATFLSCLALPMPASVLMLAAGGFSATGDIALVMALAAALAGAVLGDQIGYAIGRAGGPALIARIGRRPSRAAVMARALAALDRYGGTAIFFTRWLFSPVGPWANFAAGASGLGWLRFTLWGVAGEAVWVSLYIGTGSIFGGDLAAAGDLLTSVLGLVGAAAALALLGAWLRALIRQRIR